jgi:hypothetical protein
VEGGISGSGDFRNRSCTGWPIYYTYTATVCLFMVITFYSSCDMVQVQCDVCRKFSCKEVPGRSAIDRLTHKFESTVYVTDNKEVIASRFRTARSGGKENTARV